MLTALSLQKGTETNEFSTFMQFSFETASAHTSLALLAGSVLLEHMEFIVVRKSHLGLFDT